MVLVLEMIKGYGHLDKPLEKYLWVSCFLLPLRFQHLMHFKEEPMVEKRCSFEEGSGQVLPSKSRPAVEFLHCLLVAVYSLVNLRQVSREFLLDLYPPDGTLSAAGTWVCLARGKKARVKEKPQSFLLRFWGWRLCPLRAKVPEEDPWGTLLPDLSAVSAKQSQSGHSRRRIQGLYNQLS